MKKIGIYGGAFDPFTKGHADVIEKSLEKMSEIYIEPSSDLYKSVKCTYNERTEMIRIGLNELNNNSKKYIRVGSHDYIFSIKNKRQPYAYETLKFYKKMFGNNVELYYIIGSDQLYDIMLWKKSIRLLKKYKWLVVQRNSDNVEQVILDYPELIKFKNNISILSYKDELKISSSKFRHYMELGKEDDAIQMINNDLFLYIKRNGLYSPKKPCSEEFVFMDEQKCTLNPMFGMNRKQ